MPMQTTHASVPVVNPNASRPAGWQAWHEANHKRVCHAMQSNAPTSLEQPFHQPLAHALRMFK